MGSCQLRNYGPSREWGQTIEVIQSISAVQKRCGRLRREGKTLAMVPTMGYLHEGHLSLMREGRRRADVLVISIFVNPAQFAPHEDFDAYPRDLERDLDLAREVGVDLVFTPGDRDLYPEGYQTTVQVEELQRPLCGVSRPIFFRGVATVVAKLFNIVRPHMAIFGEKDFQQLVVIRRMAEDLNFDIRIIGGETVREPDGLAMSSRNAYLTEEQRPAALSLVQALRTAQQRVGQGKSDARRILEEAAERIRSHPDTEIDYIAVVDPETLDPMEIVDRPARMALAVKVGGTRLIDNMPLVP